MRQPTEATKYILKAFIPYTEANLLLSFKPSAFFNELEKKSGQKKRSLESAYYRLMRKGLIELDENKIPRLTKKGRTKAKLYKPTRLKFGAHLMIIFDIPEGERKKGTDLGVYFGNYRLDRSKKAFGKPSMITASTCARRLTK